MNDWKPPKYALGQLVPLPSFPPLDSFDSLSSANTFLLDSITEHHVREKEKEKEDKEEKKEEEEKEEKERLREVLTNLEIIQTLLGELEEFFMRGGVTDEGIEEIQNTASELNKILPKLMGDLRTEAISKVRHLAEARNRKFFYKVSLSTLTFGSNGAVSEDGRSFRRTGGTGSVVSLFSEEKYESMRAELIYDGVHGEPDPWHGYLLALPSLSPSFPPPPPLPSPLSPLLPLPPSLPSSLSS